jgi:hypothetical protein
MHPIIRNILAVVGGILIGMVVNGTLITMSAYIIPPPSGVDPNNMESIKANIHLFQAKHFIMPFLAHALGTLVGAFIAAKIAASHKLALAMSIGVLSLAGGIMAVSMIPAPVWFNVLDLVAAYIPMAYLGYKLAA